MNDPSSRTDNPQETRSSTPKGHRRFWSIITQSNKFPTEATRNFNGRPIFHTRMTSEDMRTGLANLPTKELKSLVTSYRQLMQGIPAQDETAHTQASPVTHYAEVPLLQPTARHYQQAPVLDMGDTGMGETDSDTQSEDQDPSMGILRFRTQNPQRPDKEDIIEYEISHEQGEAAVCFLSDKIWDGSSTWRTLSTIATATWSELYSRKKPFEPGKGGKYLLSDGSGSEEVLRIVVDVEPSQQAQAASFVPLSFSLVAPKSRYDDVVDDCMTVVAGAYLAHSDTG